MTDNEILKAIKARMLKMATKLKLQKPPTDVDVEPERVFPTVCIGYLPPKSYLPDEYDIPAVVVGYNKESGEDNGSDASLNIKLTLATYGAGSYDEEGKFNPDMTGYIELINLISCIREDLSKNPIIEKVTIMDKGPDTPFKWGTYDEQPWPYWYGWITFSVKAAVQNMIPQMGEYL